MVVGVCRVSLLVPESHSLKERRMVLRRIKDKVAHKFNVAIAEVGTGEYADSWQSAQLGFAVVSNQHAFTQSMVQKVLDYIEQISMAKLVDDEQDFINYGDERIGQEGEHWEPNQVDAVALEREFLRRAEAEAGEMDEATDGLETADSGHSERSNEKAETKE